ncbi:MAG TPA: 5-methyltetrahydropteroyltriglutamate--homocysteine S-methyltransferase [Pseudolabrys sp.]|nr:5-methyltetrahydropteroyltriglutamate--homocysteine S-methyltransferase [Pseudolabrys sp.]
MTAQSPPFKADHVGSLLRRKRLLDARAARQSGKLSADELSRIESEEVQHAVDLQKSVGLKCCTDGDFRRRHWFMDFIERIDGLRFGAPMPVRFKSTDGSVEFSPPQMELYGRLKRSQSLTGADFPLLKPVAEAAGLMPKATIPSPTLLHFRSTRSRLHSTVYPDVDQLYEDIAQVYREEIAALYANGCRYLQIDETNLPGHLSDPALREQAKKEGEDPDALVDRYARLINDSIRDVPHDMTVCMHMCRGNHAGGWFAEGGYDPVAQVSFSRIEVDGFFLEYDTPRAGSFEPLRYLADGKIAVLGLVTTKSPKLESKDELKRRIEEASQFVPVERLALSPQCGFASTIEGNPLTEDDEKRKLALIVEVASEVWG